MIKRLGLLSSLALVLPGCAIHQSVHPVDATGETQVCIIDNAQVRPAFAQAYQGALVAKGYTVKHLPPTAAITDCRVTSTYRASWRWDLAMYMTLAEIRVFVDGKEKGVALYDSTRGGANMNKFIDAEKKVAELTNELFPGGAGAPAPGQVQVQAQ